MTAEQLRNSILQEAISGRLVPQDPNDEPAEIVSTVPEDESPFELPTTWKWVRMQDVLEFINGRAYKKEELLSQGKYRVLRVGNFFTNQSWYYSDLELPEDKYCYNGDLLYAWSASFGPRIWEGEKTIFHYHIWNVKFEKDILFREYLYYFFLYDKSQVKKSTTGSTMIHVSMENMKPRLLPLPPLAEQKRIVAKLEELLPIVEQYGKAQTELDELNAALPTRLRQSILQEAISGRLVPQDSNDEPATALLQHIREEKERLVKEGKLKKKDLVETPIKEEEIPFEIPSSWVWVKISTLYQTSSGGTPEKGHPEYYGGSIPWVKVGDLKNIYIEKTEDTISEIGLNNSSAKLFPEDTILVAMYCNDAIGKSSILRLPMTTNQAICGLFPNPLLCKEYVYYAIQANRAKLQEHAAGGAQKNINQKIVNDLPIPLPPLAEQQRIVAKIEELLADINKISK